mmetsp:Transcript_69760/g.130275  ORF Transcript_69760/g.130275 Transcript_69760/m.130275 type:complete len:271 (-) Transcript_69760:32-844(-)
MGGKQPKGASAKAPVTAIIPNWQNNPSGRYGSTSDPYQLTSTQDVYRPYNTVTGSPPYDSFASRRRPYTSGAPGQRHYSMLPPSRVLTPAEAARDAHAFASGVGGAWDYYRAGPVSPPLGQGSFATALPPGVGTEVRVSGPYSHTQVIVDDPMKPYAMPELTPDQLQAALSGRPTVLSAQQYAISQKDVGDLRSSASHPAGYEVYRKDGSYVGFAPIFGDRVVVPQEVVFANAAGQPPLTDTQKRVPHPDYEPPSSGKEGRKRRKARMCC